MIDCSPGAGSASPAFRLARNERSRDKLLEQNRALRAEQTLLARDNASLSSAVAEVAADVKTARDNLTALSNTAHAIRAKTEGLADERHTLRDSASRYERLRVNCKSIVDVSDLQSQISRIRGEIVMMEKEILELTDGSIVETRIERAREERSALMEEDSDLIEKLSALTIELKILQNPGDSGEEDIPARFQRTIESSKGDSKKSSPARKKLVEVASLTQAIQTARSELAVQLQRECDVSGAIREQRKKEEAVSQLNVAITKAKAATAVWVARRSDIDVTLRVLMNLVQLFEKTGLRDVEKFVKDRNLEKQRYVGIQQQLREAKSELRQLTDDDSARQRQAVLKEIRDLQDEVGGLEREKKRLEQKAAAYESVTAIARLHQRLEAEKQIPQLEAEIHEVEVNSAMVRRQKRKLNRAIEHARAILADYGVPSAPFGGRRRTVSRQSTDL
jgi:chromosome segregation ATPase